MPKSANSTSDVMAAQAQMQNLASVAAANAQPNAAVTRPQRRPSFNFTPQDLDLVLYGYGKACSTEGTGMFALTGLRATNLSHGMERILSPPFRASKSGEAMAKLEKECLEIPKELDISQTSFMGTVHYSVYARHDRIKLGTVYGPFKGRVVNTSEIKTNDDNTFMWEIFCDSKLNHFIDGRGVSGNWMSFVNMARFSEEQNLIAKQINGEIFYEAVTDIPQGSELLLWYGDQYDQFCGIPVAIHSTNEIPESDSIDDKITSAESNNGQESFSCERCGKVFAYKYYRDKHLKYTRCVDMGDRKFPCHLCSRSFEKRDRLRIHILHVHEKHRPHKCPICGKAFSQSSSLNKHMRVHSGERPYKCVYCSKAFTASSILRTHLRQHSGEKPFKCKFCGKAFASHAAHDSHVRRSHGRNTTVNAIALTTNNTNSSLTIKGEA